ncbi:protein of unknown function (plasmid) [Cupriavidus taiwanensis]|uniref:Uncharacterized protein n=1 Tax=Cupriavidus taiwanensis TaxID=164546 RepID=A0A375EC86_9BURK|nr:protein of unknown function [Cupriavidus taiwanensis]SOZ72377.1 protein of unknown function [Cupriavidus taiwanensis]SOZ74712.1 protein of unknown function [Cupriavidus taiwanensis]SPA03584.1 protein of unknown function [Cupriavidus taiwanensis]SPA11482.1 protein of unknown function [Cupriavidus taiwanensis]
MITLMTPNSASGSTLLPRNSRAVPRVCGPLFFRYGITPTANKLYQLVCSMGIPAEVLQWGLAGTARANPRHHRTSRPATGVEGHRGRGGADQLEGGQ